MSAPAIQPTPQGPTASDATMDPYDQVAALAFEIERDERTIRNRLISALEGGQTDFALQVLREWRTTAPRDVVAKFLEDGDGNSE